MPETWIALIVTAEPELADSLSSFLIDQGAPGVITEDVAGMTRITAHFAERAPVAALGRFCRDLEEWFPLTRQPQVQVENITSANWEENWKEHFPPLSIGERLYVHPPWTAQVPRGRLGIELNPGMAFGTGHHASTRGCLLLLERAMLRAQRRRVLDVGTGSGILAIAAAKLGAAEVWALDSDPDACDAAIVNARTNRVESVVHVEPASYEPTGQFDVVLANLFATQLIEMAATIHDRLAADGVAIGAGVLEEEADSVIAAWREAGLALDVRHRESEWVTLSAHRV